MTARATGACRPISRQSSASPASIDSAGVERHVRATTALATVVLQIQ